MPTTGESVGVITILSLALKFMLLPSYESWTFEQHRKWLAITQEIELKNWYNETVSGCPLVYPPLMGYFKYGLGKIAGWVDPEIVVLGNDNYSCAVFQRLTVIFTDQMLLFAILLYCTTWPTITTTDMEWSRNKVVVVVTMILFNPGLIMVDHLNLNYSGFTTGLLLLSIALVRRGDDFGDLAGVVMFVVLLMFDHTFVPIIPLYVVYLYRHFCCVPSSNPLGGKIVLFSPDIRRRSSVSSSDGITSDDFDSGGDRDEDDGNEEDDEGEESHTSRLIRRIVATREKRYKEQAKQQQYSLGMGSDSNISNKGNNKNITTAGFVLEHMKHTLLSVDVAGDNEGSEENRIDDDDGDADHLDSPRSMIVSPSKPKDDFLELNSDQTAIGNRSDDEERKTNSVSRVPLSSTSSTAPTPVKRMGSHKRTQSDIVTGARKRKKGKSRPFQLDQSFKKLLAKPKGNRSSNLEIRTSGRQLNFVRLFVMLTLIVVTVLIILAPLLMALDGNIYELVEQLSQRLTTSSDSSLVRPYWAPNAWALYSGFDKLLLLFGGYFWGWELPVETLQALDPTMLYVLPSVHPMFCAVCISLAMVPVLAEVWDYPQHPVLLPAFVYCMTCSFMLGFHTFEKSVVFIIVPLALASCDSTMDARLCLLMSWIGHVSLLPILETPDLKTLKPVILSLHCFGSYIALDQYHVMARRQRRIRVEPNGGGVWLWAVDRAYFRGLIAAYLYAEVYQPILPFVGTIFPTIAPIAELTYLPQLVMSTYCAIGMLHCWGLALQQVRRKVAVVASYEWSPRANYAEVVSDGKTFNPSSMPHLSLFS